jgi:hypothetical protein
MAKLSESGVGMIVKISIVLVSCLIGAYGQTTACKLPAPLSQMVADRWRGWSLLQVSDLVPDDQSLWRKDRGRACPGFVSGHFLSLDKLSYAFSLVNRKSDEQQVILAVPMNGVFETHILDGPSQVARFSVIHDLPPGKYTEVEGGRTVRTTLDSIAYETIEAGETMFYEERGSFHSLTLSE